MDPLTFVPLPMERVWGGRRLADLLGRELPAAVPVGESWELVDREDEQSVVAGGPWAGRTLNDLWTQHCPEVFGARGAAIDTPRFPLLVKLLDARQTLSVQVHPPAHAAAALEGEPKTEMWVLAAAEPDAHLYAGLRRGIGRDEVEAALQDGSDVSALLHRIDVQPGDAMFLPSGRVHALGGGCLVVEIQQSSDTTYRVYDFDRPGLDGNPRELHIEPALASIDFDDHEPGLLTEGDEPLIACEPFTVARWTLDGPRQATQPGECALLVGLAGEAVVGGERVTLGSTVLVPAEAADPMVRPVGDAETQVLVVELTGV